MDLDIGALLLFGLFVAIWLGAKVLKALAKKDPALRQSVDNLTRGEGHDPVGHDPGERR